MNDGQCDVSRKSVMRVVSAGDMLKDCRFVLARGGGCLALVQGFKTGFRGDNRRRKHGIARAQDLDLDDFYGTIFVTLKRI